MKKYFLHDGSTQYGPFDLAELETKIITPQTMVWFDPLPNWKPAGEIDELRDLLNKKVPAAQVLTPPTLTGKQEDWTKKMYYYADSHGQQGPFTYEQLKSRPIQASTPVWYDPLPEWTTADKIPGLISIISHEAEKLSNPVSPAPARQYYFLDSANQKNGPFNLDQLKGKGINTSTFIWYEPLPEWTTAGKVPELIDIISVGQPQSPAPASQKRLYFFIDGSGQQQGPFDLEQLKSKSITPETHIWYEGLASWKKAGAEDSLRTLLSAAAANSADWSKKLFYYTDATGQQGPFTLEQMKTKIFTASTPVWYDPLPNWTTAGQVDALRPYIR